ncbi:MAG: methylmalonyl Co-A mutase-associated GTPase MeaB [Bacteroidetes bacterium]|nr:methylmalonyl Co-A mutase-associated GTPase MeaB [Bacteroidota bacterium]
MIQEKNNSALKVNKGIQQPSSVNDDVAKNFINKKKEILYLNDYIKGILSGDITILSRAITLVESNLPKHYSLAQKIIERCIPYSGNSIRIGITGVPGVGKSTFIEAFGKYLTSQRKKIAVLAIDPSSIISKGSILGDKTRMEELSNDPNAFIRPSPSAGSLGGVARKTRESIILCEAAGFDTIIVETVGVGQSEMAVNFMVDFFLLLMLAGAGDELQGIKKGIMEMADAIIINKADKENIQKADVAKSQYQNALHLFPPSASGWIPLVETCSSKTKMGIEQVWKIISNYIELTKSNGYFELTRKEQAKHRMIEMINENLRGTFYQNEKVAKLFPVIENDLLAQKISSYAAAEKLLDVYYKSLEEKK